MTILTLCMHNISEVPVETNKHYFVDLVSKSSKRYNIFGRIKSGSSD